MAFGILSLLPVELILQVGSSDGFAMVFALLVAAIIWNLGTWYLSLPAMSVWELDGGWFDSIGILAPTVLKPGAVRELKTGAEKLGEGTRFFSEE